MEEEDVRQVQQGTRQRALCEKEVVQLPEYPWRDVGLPRDPISSPSGCKGKVQVQALFCGGGGGEWQEERKNKVQHFKQKIALQGRRRQRTKSYPLVGHTVSFCSLAYSSSKDWSVYRKF